MSSGRYQVVLCLFLLDNELYWLVSSCLGMHVVLVRNRAYRPCLCNGKA